jgi:hypothetical protein
MGISGRRSQTPPVLRADVRHALYHFRNAHVSSIRGRAYSNSTWNDAVRGHKGILQQARKGYEGALAEAQVKASDVNHFIKRG